MKRPEAIDWSILPPRSTIFSSEVGRGKGCVFPPPDGKGNVGIVGHESRLNASTILSRLHQRPHHGPRYIWHRDGRIYMQNAYPLGRTKRTGGRGASSENARPIDRAKSPIIFSAFSSTITMQNATTATRGGLSTLIVYYSFESPTRTVATRFYRSDPSPPPPPSPTADHLVKSSIANFIGFLFSLLRASYILEFFGFFAVFPVGSF